ncbi:alpha/beta hydrolase [Solicola sp. PLA-1-18]|uniref:alpha/beta hydrolase n=1 Tax=Solicola sp. PLA-1-18 TaxID=3380532 RepID=UPI003B800536
MADLRAWLMQKSAVSVRYGQSLQLAHGEHPGPTVLRVPTRHGDVRCDVYHATEAGCPPPVYVHLHGGAFVMRRPEMDDFFARVVATEVGATVVNVDYDVAPQRRYPVAQHQAHDVAAWVAAHGADQGWDGARVALGGFSAGGNLAASACLQARDLGSFSPALQLLGVPSLDVAEPVAAKRSPLAQPMISPALLDLVRATYFADESRRLEPYASPLLAPDLRGLPRAMVLTGELDVLRREGDAYAGRLQEAGVPVRHVVVPDRDHYFLDGDRAPGQAREVLDRIVAELRDALVPTA